MGTSLVIVESPAKARTIEGYLGTDYAVGSSVGHVRDLPDRARDVPEAQRKRFGALGVDVDRRLRAVLRRRPGEEEDHRRPQEARSRSADELLLATDEDREGEAIAWHLVQVLKPEGAGARAWSSTRSRRTRSRARLEETREIDDRLVDAQETRRILDRLVRLRGLARALEEGHARALGGPRAVGRDAPRRRPRARADARSSSAAYWDHPRRRSSPARSRRASSQSDGTRVAQGRDFGPRPASYRCERRLVARRGRARDRSPHALDGRRVRRRARSSEKPVHDASRRRRSAPSTLQQEASRKLRFSAQTTMRVAQRLYENGYITYMRTDSTTLSESALDCRARAGSASSTAPTTVPDEPRRYERAVANAQEAHEAIRPAGDAFRTPEELASELTATSYALYDLDLEAHGRLADEGRARSDGVDRASARTSSDGEDVRVRRVGHGHHVPRLPRRLRVGHATSRRTTTRSARLPHADGRPDASRLARLEPDGHATSPPARYTEASARAGARGARHRPAVDVRRDHRHDPRPRLRVQEGHGARSHVRRLRGRQPARAALRPAGRLRLHRADGGRPRPHRRR